MMLNSYKALFKVMKGDSKGAMECYSKADQSRKPSWMNLFGVTGETPQVNG